MVQHKKEIGIRKESSDSSDMEESKIRTKKKSINEDDDGFTTVQTKNFKCSPVFTTTSNTYTILGA